MHKAYSLHFLWSRFGCCSFDLKPWRIKCVETTLQFFKKIWSKKPKSTAKESFSAKCYSWLLESFFTLFPGPELKLDLRAIFYIFCHVSLPCHRVGKFFWVMPCRWTQGSLTPWCGSIVPSNRETATPLLLCFKSVSVTNII